MNDPNEPTELGAVDARAGETTGRVRYILGISLVLIIVVFAILFFR
ncbi:hypothetical protein [Sphingomonas bacterium]|nr:hypothetical protein [Sphingomonas bacterium]